MTLMHLARAERADLLELLTGLTPQQWDGPTLCTGWRVRDVFAHFAPPIGAFWRARGLRLLATDLDWVAGRGREVHGPAEALLMAISGRRGVVQELTGPG